MKKGYSGIFTVVFIFLLIGAVSFALLSVNGIIGGDPDGESSDISVPDNASSAVSAADNSAGDASSPEDDSSLPAADSRVSFLACPDNIIHPSVYYDAIEQAAKKKGVNPVYSPLGTADYDFSGMYTEVADAIKNADLSYVNVETMIGGNNNQISGYPMFNSPEAAGLQLIDLGFDIFNLAHNHMLDSNNDKYLKNCNAFFESRGKTTLGYYKNKDDFQNIKIIEKNGIKIAFLAFTYGTNGIVLPSGSDTYIPYLNERDINTQVAIAKEKADFIIVSAHWGNEDTYTPINDQKTYANIMIKAGVDVILGMHPHCLQPMSWETNSDGHKTLLVYSLGNFISGMYGGLNMLGGMLNIDIVKNAETGAVTMENVLIDAVVTHYTKPGGSLNSSDTGHRNYKLYYLKDYTQELASQHQAVKREKAIGATTLKGGGFSRENLIKTLQSVIPSEFLPSEFKY